jgi:hypothetical protein
VPGEATAGVDAVAAASAGFGRTAVGGDVMHELQRRCIPRGRGLSPAPPSWCGGESRSPGGRCIDSASASRGVSSVPQSVDGPKTEGPSQVWKGSLGSHGSPSGPCSGGCGLATVGGVHSVVWQEANLFVAISWVHRSSGHRQCGF